MKNMAFELKEVLSPLNTMRLEKEYGGRIENVIGGTNFFLGR